MLPKTVAGSRRSVYSQAVSHEKTPLTAVHCQGRINIPRCHLDSWFPMHFRDTDISPATNVCPTSHNTLCISCVPSEVHSRRTVRTAIPPSAALCNAVIRRYLPFLKGFQSLPVSLPATISYEIINTIYQLDSKVNRHFHSVKKRACQRSIHLPLFLQHKCSGAGSSQQGKQCKKYYRRFISGSR